MKRDSLLFRYLDLTAAAVFSAAATNPEKGFRGKDVRFFLELFSNWIEIDFPDGMIQVQNVQISRFLSELLEKGIITSTNRKKVRPSFHLTRSGVLELSSMLFYDKEQGRRQRFYFIYYFISSYREIILSMLKGDTKRYSYMLVVDLERILDPKDFLEQEIKNTKKEIEKIKARISHAHKSAELFESRLKSEKDLSKAIKNFQHEFPYALNNIRPLNELIKILPQKLQLRELGEGSIKRSIEIWTPHLHILESHLANLNSLNKD